MVSVIKIWTSACALLFYALLIWSLSLANKLFRCCQLTLQCKRSWVPISTSIRDQHDVCYHTMFRLVHWSTTLSLKICCVHVFVWLIVPGSGLEALQTHNLTRCLRVMSQNIDYNVVNYCLIIGVTQLCTYCVIVTSWRITPNLIVCWCNTVWALL